jgi:outer membrane lipoprotein-sorting protein
MAIWLALLFLFPPAAVTPETDGAEILEKSARAYALLDSYVGTTTVQGVAEFAGGRLDQTATARIVFTRPAKIRIEGKDASEHPYAIVSDGVDTWTSWKIRNDGAFEKATSLELAIAAMTGVAQGAPTTIPGALLRLAWGNPFVPGSDVHSDGQEAVEGAVCYKVVQRSRVGKTTFWVDTRSFLLRRMKVEHTQDEIAEAAKMAEAATKAIGKSSPLPDTTLKSSENDHFFVIEKINSPVDSRLFSDPTRPR